MDEKKRLLLEVLRELKEAKLAEIQERIEEKKESREEYEALSGCDLHGILKEMAEEGVIEKEVPEWGAPTYRVIK